jgi:hypothetical protein
VFGKVDTFWTYHPPAQGEEGAEADPKKLMSGGK